MHNGIHSSLHLIQVLHLVEQRLMIYTADMRIKRAKQNWYIRTNRMHSILTEIVELCEIFRGYVEECNRRVVFHLLITTLYCIGKSLRCIRKWLCIIQACVIFPLANGEQNANTS